MQLFGLIYASVTPLANGTFEIHGKSTDHHFTFFSSSIYPISTNLAQHRTHRSSSPTHPHTGQSCRLSHYWFAQSQSHNFRSCQIYFHPLTLGALCQLYVFCSPPSPYSSKSHNLHTLFHVTILLLSHVSCQAQWRTTVDITQTPDVLQCLP